ncbi:sodium/glutamate symporter [Desulfovibrio sp.]|uniref:sodium/glutamate symporter n=2 Tax=Desulfovibrio sp. TaxID=885 RepID=UPI003079DB62
MGESFYPYIGAMIWISLLLCLATFLRSRIKILQTFLVPASLIGGILGFICVNLGIVGMPTMEGWQPIPTKVFSVMTFHLFAFGFVGVGLMKSKETNTSKLMFRGGLWMALMYCFIWSVQGIIGKSVFELWHMTVGGDFDSCLGYLLGCGFAQGPGQAHAYGSIWETTYHVGNAMSMGLASAAMGFVVAVVIGVPLAYTGIRRGWISGEHKGSLPEFFLRGIMKKGDNPACAKATTHSATIDSFAFHLALMGVVYGLAYTFGLYWTLFMPAGVNGLGFGLLYTWGMCLAMLTRFVLNKTGSSHILDGDTVRRITNTSVDFMVCAVFLAISVSELQSVLMPFLIAVILAALATLVLIMWYARRAPEYNFERGIACFGCYTGTVATGMLLLRIVDPEFESPAAIELGIMNVIILLLSQPLTVGYPFIPSEACPMFLIMVGYVVVVPIAMYMLKLVKKVAW